MRGECRAYPLGCDRFRHAANDGLATERKNWEVAAKHEIPSDFRYAEGVVDSPEQIAKAGDFSEKPFLQDDLARKVREILGRVDARQEHDSHPANTSSELFSDKSGTGTSGG